MSTLPQALLSAEPPLASMDDEEATVVQRLDRVIFTSNYKYYSRYPIGGSVTTVMFYPPLWSNKAKAAADNGAIQEMRNAGRSVTAPGAFRSNLGRDRV